MKSKYTLFLSWQFHELAEQFRGEMPLKRSASRRGYVTVPISRGARSTVNVPKIALTDI